MGVVKGSLKFRWSSLVMMGAFLLAGCLENDGDDHDIGSQLEGQRFDLDRTQRFIEEEKLKLATMEKAAADSKLAASVADELATVSETLEKAKVRNLELSDEVELAEVEFDQYRARYRKMVRSSMVGTEVDLSSTKGDEYKKARVLGIDPTAVKVYRSSGPESVPIRDLPKALVEKLQMDEEEAAKYVEKLALNSKARARQFAEWKRKQAEKKEDVPVEEYDERIKELRIAIFESEQAIRGRLREVKAWKSKASGLDARAAEERTKGKRPRSERLAELARDKANNLTDQNADSRIVIERSKAQLQYLERLAEAQKAK